MALATKRIANLDLVRAFAIIAVMYYHVTQMFFWESFANKSVFTWGHHGVTVFFVLSGFLIGGLYYQKEHSSAVKFWLSRFLRTYPPYFIMLFVSWALVYVTRKDAFDWGYLLMIQNFYPRIPYFLVSWSLCVEEHFYLLFFLLILLLPRKQFHLYFWLTLGVTCVFLRAILYQRTGDFGFDEAASIFHLDSLATGVIASYLVYQRKFSVWGNKTIFGLVLCLIIAISYFFTAYNNELINVYGIILLNLLIAYLILLAYQLPALAIAEFKILKLSAKMAYSLYLVHPILIHVCLRAFGLLHIDHVLIKLTFGILSIYAASYVFYLFIEKQSIIFRNNFIQTIKK